MVKIDLLSKKRVSTKNISFIQFLYPTYPIVNSLSEYINSDYIVYTGLVSESNLKKLDLIFKDYIIISDYGDIVLNSVQDYIKVFYPSQIDKYSDYEAYSIDDFLDILKCSLVLGKPLPSISNKKVSLYHLYESLVGSTNDMIHTYMEVLDEYPMSVVYSSILTFLYRVKSKDWESVSKGYRALLNRASIKFGSRIDSVLLDSVEYSGSDELTLLNILWSLMNGRDN